MSDENIQINVSETGTSAIIQQLEALGVAGDQATARVATGFVRLSTSQQAAVSNQVLLSRAAQNNTADLGTLASALDKMSNAELNAAARSDVLTAANNRGAQAAQGAASAANTNAAAQTRASTAVAGAAGAHNGLGAAAGGAAGNINTATAATGRNTAAAASGTSGLRAHASATASVSQAYGNLKGILQAVVGAISVHAFVELSDEATTLKNRVSAVVDTLKGFPESLSTSSTRIFTLGGAVQTTAGQYQSAVKALVDFDSGIRSNNGSIAAAQQQAGAYQDKFAKLAPSIEKAYGTHQMWNSVLTQSVSIGATANSDADQRARLVAKLTASYKEMADEQDRASISQRLFTSASSAARDVLDKLSKAAIDNGTSFESSVELFQKLEAEGKKYGITTNDAVKFTTTFSQLLRTYPPGVRQSAAAIRELSQGFATGNLEGRQLTALLREFPQALDPVIKATGKTFEQLKEGGIPIKELTDAFERFSGEIAAKAANSVFTIGSAFESLHTKLIVYVGTSKTIADATDLLVGGIKILGDNLQIVVPIVGGLALAFAGLKLASIVANVLTLAGVFTPLGATITAIVGFLAAFTNGILDFKVQTGEAKDKTDAFFQLLNLLAPAFDIVKDVVKDVAAQFNVIASQFTGTTDTAHNLETAIKAVGVVVAAVAIVIGSFVKDVLYGLDLVVTSVGKVIAFFKNLKSAVQGKGSTVAYPAYPEIPTQQRDGGVQQFRSGGIYARDGFTVPGMDKPDTVPVHMMVSKGERVIVQTVQQQAKHDAIMKAANDNRFADGGTFVAAGGNSVTGYSGFSVTPQAAATTVTTATGTTNTATAKTTPAVSKAYDFTNRTGQAATKAVDQVAYKNGLQPYPGTIANQVGYYQKPGDPLPVVDQFGSNLTKSYSYGGAAGSGVKTAVISGVPSPGFGAAVGAQAWGGVSFNDYYKSISGHLPVDPTFNLRGGSSGKITGQNVSNAYRDGGTFHARDGLDYDVPGAGAVDSRVMRLAVSPGENVSVSTADQKAKNARNGGGQTIVQNITTNVQASDPGAFNRSTKQRDQETAKRLKRAS